MLAEEFGLSSATRSPLRAALSTFGAFVLAGIVPLLPFAFGLPDAAETAAVMTGVVFFVIGSIKSRWSPKSSLASGLETTTIGLSAAALAYAVGYGLQMLV